MPAAFYLGIDAGGTKTHALIADHEGHVRGTGRAGPGNWEDIGLEAAHQSLAQALAQALDMAELQVGDLCAGGYGLSGLDWPSDEVRLEPIVRRLGIPGPQVLVNDAYVALSAGSPDGCGVAIISGTGTTVAGRNRAGEVFRTFGLGHMWGDFGAGGDIVMLAVRAAAYAHIGRGQPTVLTERLVKQYGTRDFAELAEQVTRRQIGTPGGRLAPLVFEVAAEGDSVAQEVIRAAGLELGQNAAAVARRLGLEEEDFNLVLAGGVFRANSTLFIDGVLEPVRACAPTVRPVILRVPPVVGSVALAMQAAGLELAAEIWQRLETGAIEHLG